MTLEFAVVTPAGAVAPKPALPQATTDQSALRATKAELLRNCWVVRPGDAGGMRADCAEPENIPTRVRVGDMTSVYNE